MILCLGAAALLAALPQQPRREPVELRPINNRAWIHGEDVDGDNPSPETVLRNRQKNRPWTGRRSPGDWTISKFVDIAHIYDQALGLQGLNRGDLLNQPKRIRQLEKLENRIVSVTGYLVTAWAGPKETVNYQDEMFHDWHLDLYDQPFARPLKAGDPTPLIAEITRFTERKLYDKGVRLQKLIASYHWDKDRTLAWGFTGHRAHRVRITGYLFWDDGHNVEGFDHGPLIEIAPPNVYYHPWRRTAWEIHPVTNIEDLGE